MRNRTLLFAAIVMLLGLFAGRAAAHPVPTLNYDRIVRISLDAKGVRVDYRLEVDDSTIQVDGSQIIKPEDFARLRASMRDKTPTEIGDRAFANAIAEFILDRLQASQDGKPLTFRENKPAQRERKDNLVLNFKFEAEWAKPLAEGQQFEFSMMPEEKDSLHLESGRLSLSFHESQGVILTKKKEPNPDLEWTSDLDFKRAPKMARKLRSASATMGPLKATSATPPPAPSPELHEAPPTEEPSIFTQVRKRGLAALLDSNLGFGLILLIAVVVGAAHALTPGHGKTLVAAYLVGERGTVGHAMLLGLVTTVTHTGIVIILAAILPWILRRFEQSQVQAILGFGGGFVIAGMGLWLLLKRLSGQADHVHVGGGHHHHHHDGHHHHHHDGHHDHHHEHPAPGEKVSTWNLITLGISGGIVPCWDAIALLAWSISTGRAHLGLPLLLAFSAGLAGVLVLVGILVVKVKRFGASKLGEGRLVRALPIISAIALTVLGAWLCIDSVTGK